MSYMCRLEMVHGDPLWLTPIVQHKILPCLKALEGPVIQGL